MRTMIEILESKEQEIAKIKAKEEEIDAKFEI